AFDIMEKYFPASKIVLTGNPIRGNIVKGEFSSKTGRAHFKLDENKPTIFVTGGSLGARVINEAIAASLDQLLAGGIQVIWQTGKVYLDQFKHLESENVRVLDFISRMDAAYAAADIIISRAGGTISELCIIGKPAILLPSPNVAEDHQAKNVAALRDKGAAVLIKDSEAKEKLGAEILELIQDEARRNTIAQNIKKLAKPDAANSIAKEVLSLIK
ncbi:MAG: UDP-N-acetylglucosamine--N-acetylmuramyl-(pentapeptide) pyrophosphoryl-undecaprenol N-acetylglucosamine transferase, partial [Limisphaerales bacterium]